jgi:putative ABC transport system permease protein
MVSGSIAGLRNHDAVIVDEVGAAGLLSVPADGGDGSARELRLDGKRRALAVGDELLINDRRVIVAGIARVSPRFMARPTVYTTYSRAMSIVPPERNQLSYVLVRAAAGVDAEVLAARIEAKTGLKARTSRQFSSDTQGYYIRNTDVLSQVGFMVTLGTVVGLAISGQLLYLFTYDNLRHYAALKAMGLSGGRLVGMIAGQSLFASAVGFGLGVGTACLMGLLLVRVGMPFLLVWQTPMVVGGVTLLIATVSGVMCGVTALRTEPAAVFKA